MLMEKKNQNEGGERPKYRWVQCPGIPDYLPTCDDDSPQKMPETNNKKHMSTIGELLTEIYADEASNLPQ